MLMEMSLTQSGFGMKLVHGSTQQWTPSMKEALAVKMSLTTSGFGMKLVHGSTQ